MFGRVTSLIPSMRSNVNRYDTDLTNLNEMFDSSIGKFTVSRHFSTSGDGKSLLHNTIDKSSLQRHAGAPLCSNLEASDFNPFPIKLL